MSFDNQLTMGPQDLVPPGAISDPVTSPPPLPPEVQPLGVKYAPLARAYQRGGLISDESPSPADLDVNNPDFLNSRIQAQDQTPGGQDLWNPAVGQDQTPSSSDLGNNPVQFVTGPDGDVRGIQHPLAQEPDQREQAISSHNAQGFLNNVGRAINAPVSAVNMGLVNNPIVNNPIQGDSPAHQLFRHYSAQGLPPDEAANAAMNDVAGAFGHIASDSGSDIASRVVGAVGGLANFAKDFEAQPGGGLVKPAIAGGAVLGLAAKGGARAAAKAATAKEIETVFGNLTKDEMDNLSKNLPTATKALQDAIKSGDGPAIAKARSDLAALKVPDEIIGRSSAQTVKQVLADTAKTARTAGVSEDDIKALLAEKKASLEAAISPSAKANEELAAAKGTPVAPGSGAALKESPLTGSDANLPTKQAASAKAMNEPPIPDGYVRLYRGADAGAVPITSKGGEFFGTNRGQAELFAQAHGGPNAEINYVDVPNSTFTKLRAGSAEFDPSFVVPDSIASGKQSLGVANRDAYKAATGAASAPVPTTAPVNTTPAAPATPTATVPGAVREPTDWERQQVAKSAKTLYSGREVNVTMADGSVVKGTATGANAFGKAEVRLADGRQLYVGRSAITPADPNAGQVLNRAGQLITNKDIEAYDALPKTGPTVPSAPATQPKPPVAPVAQPPGVAAPPPGAPPAVPAGAGGAGGATTPPPYTILGAKDSAIIKGMAGVNNAVSAFKSPMASADVSLSGRQFFAYALSHPQEWVNGLKGAVAVQAGLKSQAAANTEIGAIKTRVENTLQQYGLDKNLIEIPTPGQGTTATSTNFGQSWITKGKFNPIGPIVERSEAAASLTAARIRGNVFDAQVAGRAQKALEGMGISVPRDQAVETLSKTINGGTFQTIMQNRNDMKALGYGGALGRNQVEDLANFLGHSTGHGYNMDEGSKFQQAAHMIGSLAMFSPQNNTARVRFFGDVLGAGKTVAWDAIHLRAPDPVDMEKLRVGAGYAGGIMGILYAAHQAGLGDVNFDPTSTNFLKIDLGTPDAAKGPLAGALSGLGLGVQTYNVNGEPHVFLDPTGGGGIVIREMVRDGLLLMGTLGSQAEAAGLPSPYTLSNLSGTDIAGRTPGSELGSYARGRLSPVLGVANDALLQNKSNLFEPDLNNPLVGLFVPLVLQDILQSTGLQPTNAPTQQTGGRGGGGRSAPRGRYGR